MVRVRALAVDIDGTLTVDRGVFTLDLEAASLLRRVHAQNVHVILVTGNSVPVVAGLARYLGFEDSPQVAENGCMVFYRGLRIRVCGEDVRPAAQLIEKRLGEFLYPSWQNVYRHCDYAYNLKKGVDVHKVLEEARRLIEEAGFTGVSLGYSGYAIHVRPSCATKAGGLRKALSLINIEPQEVIAVGDSAMDAELKESAAVLAAVGNADPELKKKADIVLPGKSAESVKILLNALLDASLDMDRALQLLRENR